MKKTLLSLLAATSITTMISCKGDVGPQGPQGEQGPAGTNGSSNITTKVVTLNNSDWGYDAGTRQYYSNVEVLEITQAVVDEGTVQIFMGDGKGDRWLAMPVSYGEDYYAYYYSLEAVKLLYGNMNSNTPDNPGQQQFKIVVIPPAEKMANPDIDWSNYYEIADRFHLK